jgi:HAD superfamily phosphoserine phosphatase-like hydrolase
MNAPENIAAFFDLDGTLLRPPSLEWRFIGYLLEREQTSSAHVASWLARFAKTILRDPQQAIEGNKLYLAGISESLVTDWENSLARASSPEDSLALFDQGLQRIARHHAQGHHIFLITGTLAPLAQMMARRISAQVQAPIEPHATQLEASPWHSHSWPCSATQWTGQLAGDHMSGQAKSRAVKTLAAIHNLDLAQSYAYGDSTADLPMLESVAHPHAVNPSRHLASIAQQHNWPTFHWKEPAPTISNSHAAQHGISSTKSAKI